MRGRYAVWRRGAVTVRGPVVFRRLRRFTTVIVVRLRRVLRVWVCRSSGSGFWERVLRFNAAGPEGLKDRKAAGPPRTLSEERRAAPAMIVERGPDPALPGVVRWRRCDLAAWLRERFAVSLAETTGGRELRRTGSANLSARPRHYARDETAPATFKKTSPNA